MALLGDPLTTFEGQFLLSTVTSLYGKLADFIDHSDWNWPKRSILQQIIGPIPGSLRLGLSSEDRIFGLPHSSGE